MKTLIGRRRSIWMSYNNNRSIIYRVLTYWMSGEMIQTMREKTWQKKSLKPNALQSKTKELKVGRKLLDSCSILTQTLFTLLWINYECLLVTKDGNLEREGLKRSKSNFSQGLVPQINKIYQGSKLQWLLGRLLCPDSNCLREKTRKVKKIKTWQTILKVMDR